MEKIQNYSINNKNYYSQPVKGSESSQESFNLEAHNSANLKVERPKISPNDLMITLPVQKPFSDKEATKRMQAINTDIYEGATKEKEKHEFNLKRFFTIFGIIAMLTGAIAYFRKGGGK